jgi:hypothetical protein
MYLCATCIDFASFYDFSIGFSKCSDSVVFYVLHLTTVVFYDFHFTTVVFYDFHLTTVVFYDFHFKNPNLMEIVSIDFR